jgi:hypothetical protein
MSLENLSRVPIVLFCLAFARPAAAQLAAIVQSIRDAGPIWSPIVWTTAAVVFVGLVFVHELSAVLALCPLAAPIRAQSAGPTNGSASDSREAIAHSSASVSRL